jgi:hypothetical protein
VAFSVKENAANQPGIFSKPTSSSIAIPQKPVDRGYLEEGCQAELQPQMSSPVFGGLTVADQIWISEAFKQELKTQSIQTEAFLIKKITKLEETVAELIRARPLPVSQVPPSLTYNVHIAPTSPQILIANPFPKSEEGITKPVGRELLSTQIDQLIHRVAGVRTGKALIAHPSEGLLDILERQIWEELLGDSLRLAGQTFKRLNCA